MSELIQLRRSPLINRAIDNTALKDFTQCDWKYWASMIEGRRRSGGAQSPALAAGTSWHKMMEVHYKSGGDREMVMLALQTSWQPHDKPDDHRTPDRLRVVYDDYLRHWGDHDMDSRNNGATVGFPHQPLVEIPVELGWPEAATNAGPIEGSLHPYTGKIDRIIEWQGLFYVEDHKTTSALGSTYFRQFDPSNQMMGYAWLAQKMTGLPIAGVRINAVGILKTQTKLARQVVSFAPPRLAEWANNYNRLVERLENGYRRLAAGDPVDIAFPRTWQCNERYGMCQYTDVCTTLASRRGVVLENEFVVSPWNPMESADDELVAE